MAPRLARQAYNGASCHEAPSECNDEQSSSYVVGRNIHPYQALQGNTEAFFLGGAGHRLPVLPLRSASPSTPRSQDRNPSHVAVNDRSPGMSTSAHDLRLRRATSPTTEALDLGSEGFSGGTSGANAVPSQSISGITPYRLTSAFITLVVGIAKISASVLTHSFDVVDVAVMLVSPVLLYLVDQIKSKVKSPGPVYWFFNHKLEFRGSHRSRDRQHTPSLPSSPVKVVYENAFDQHVASYSAMLHNYLQRDQRTPAPEIVYVEEMSGEPHDPTWSATCAVAEINATGHGTGKTKTQARHQAAKRVLVELGVLYASST